MLDRGTRGMLHTLPYNQYHSKNHTFVLVNQNLFYIFLIIQGVAEGLCHDQFLRLLSAFCAI